jgi:hypothetical protein
MYKAAVVMAGCLNGEWMLCGDVDLRRQRTVGWKFAIEVGEMSSRIHRDAGIRHLTVLAMDRRIEPARASGSRQGVGGSKPHAALQVQRLVPVQTR